MGPVGISAMSTTNPRALLTRAGEALYGARWQSDLARALGVGPRRVREWIASERSIPPGIWDEIDALLIERQNECRSAAEAIRAAIALECDLPISKSG